MLIRNLGFIAISALFCGFTSLVLTNCLNFNSDYWHLSIVYFSVLHFGINVFYTLKSNSPDFSGLLFGGVVLKLLLAMIIIVTLSFLIPDFFNFSVNFILHYIFFTIFEIRYLLPLINKKKPISDEHKQT